MERWLGKVAVVTGASSGIGADVTLRLAKEGMQVVGLARRKERVEQLAHKLDPEVKGKIYALECNVTEEKEIAEAFKWIDAHLGPVSVLINNAGLTRIIHFAGKGSTEGWRDILNTNILGLSLCIRYALESMQKHNIEDGQFININSIVGHMMPNSEWPGTTMYFASKHAVTVLTDGLRKELVGLKSKIRVASISPGVVKTEFMEVCGDPNYVSYDIYNSLPYLEPEHITSGIIYILSTPPIVNDYKISELLCGPLKKLLHGSPVVRKTSVADRFFGYLNYSTET